MSSLDPTTQYKHLFASPPPRPATPQAFAPTGGSNWDSGLGSYTADQARFSPSGAGSADQLRQGMLGIFQRGVERDLAGQNQLATLQRGLAALSQNQLTNLQGLLGQAGTQAEQIFILKAYAAGEPWENLVQFASEMRGYPEDEIIRRATMRDDADLIQQWQDSCGPAVLQAIAGEADPRFAWELNKVGDLARIDPLGANRILADQQKEWLERYGGVAVQRGAAGGQGIALNQMLNDMMGPLTGVTYSTQEVQGPLHATGHIAQILQSGHDVPLRVSWDRPGSAQDSGHFILAMAARGTAGNREFQIHDPWTGKTAWVHERNIERDDFSPIFTSYARMSHYYPAHPRA